MSLDTEEGSDRFPRRSSDWAIDEWDEVGEVPAVEPLPRQSRIIKWSVWGGFVVVVILVLIAGWVGWWYIERVKPDGELGEAGAVHGGRRRHGRVVGERVSRRRDSSTTPRCSRWYVDREGGLEVAPGYYQLRPGDHVGNVLARLRTPPDETYAASHVSRGIHGRSDGGAAQRRAAAARRSTRSSPPPTTRP